MPECPDENDVLGLLHGWLDPERRSEVHRHVDTCVQCRTLVAELARGASPTEGDGPPPEPAPKLVAERYRLGARLGKGAHGVVWAAEDLATGEDVALKIVAADRELTQRLRREGKLQEARHPNLVAVYGVCEHDGAPVLVMERLHGRTLRQRLVIGPRFGAIEIVELFTGLLAGLAALHARGILHRDLKPDNVYLTIIGPKILDFGLAKWLDGGSGTLRTRTGHSVGTPAYMAPEQIFGQTDLDARVDVWALGALVLECLTGEVPFGVREPGLVIRAASQRRPRPLLQIWPGADRALARLVDRTLSPTREDRPTIEELRATLPSLLGRQTLETEA